MIVPLCRQSCKQIMIDLVVIRTDVLTYNIYMNKTICLLYFIFVNQTTINSS